MHGEYVGHGENEDHKDLVSVRILGKSSVAVTVAVAVTVSFFAFVEMDERVDGKDVDVREKKEEKGHEGKNHDDHGSKEDVRHGECRDGEDEHDGQVRKGKIFCCRLDEHKTPKTSVEKHQQGKPYVSFSGAVKE